MPHAGVLPVIPSDFRSVLGRFPSGVAVVTGMTDAGCAGLTVQSFVALSLDPSLVLVSIARTSASWPAIKAANRICVNILGESHADVAVSFARSGGPKFDGCEWRPGRTTGAPVLAAATAWIEADIWQIYDGGDHEIVVARVLDLEAAEHDPLPLVYFKSDFARLDPELRNAQQ